MIFMCILHYIKSVTMDKVINWWQLSKHFTQGNNFKLTSLQLFNWFLFKGSILSGWLLGKGKGNPCRQEGHDETEGSQGLKVHNSDWVPWHYWFSPWLKLDCSHVVTDNFSNKGDVSSLPASICETRSIRPGPLFIHTHLRFDIFTRIKKYLQTNLHFLAKKSCGCKLLNAELRNDEVMLTGNSGSLLKGEIMVQKTRGKTSINVNNEKTKLKGAQTDKRDKQERR